MIGGIIGYGSYIPTYRISIQELLRVRGGNAKRVVASLEVEEKSVPGKDEDTVTMGVSAAKDALVRAGIDAEQIGAVYVGSESHPYAVKPSATLVGQALGIGKKYYAADMEFACKGGTAALQTSLAFVASGMCRYALAIGSDTAQAAPGDILEYTASAGGAAFIVGKEEENSIAIIEKTVSITTDTPDFWRRNLQKFPQHTGRFTAQPAYCYHVVQAAERILQESNMSPSDFDFVVFHQPNGKFPVMAASRLGFTPQQYQPALLASKIGNPYAASVLLGLTKVFDQARPDQKILVVSYGSGSGSDAFIIRTTDKICSVVQQTKTTMDFVKHKKMLTYAQYERLINGESV
ncbi:MAG: hydroxymethylglutaryl-CoA synthase [bacterium]